MAKKIAKDVLKHLNSFRRVETGTYISGEVPQLEGAEKNENAQDYVDTITEKCDVCALGACMLSFVRLYDDVTLDDLNYRSISNYELIEATFPTIKKKLLTAFSAKQLILIESAFEKESINNTLCIDVEDAISFGEAYPNNTDRLKAIMENIVENKGKFKPEILVEV